MRLIDGAIQPMLFANYILERKDTFVKVLEKGDNDFLFAMLMDYFDMQPTAYNPEKVVEQLKEASYTETQDDMNPCVPSEVVNLESAVKIVRGGGVDGD